MPENDCVFCDIEQFRERLVAETDGFYLIATLGQITDGGYLLVVPKEHVICCGALSNERMKRMIAVLMKALFAVCAEYEAEDITVFEHGMTGQTVKHAHLHILPARLDFESRVARHFPDKKIINLTLKELQRKFYWVNRPYLYWLAESAGKFRERVVGDLEVPAQYLRTLAAEELGRPERANWRTMDAALDRKLWSETVKRLKPYFEGDGR